MRLRVATIVVWMSLAALAVADESKPTHIPAQAPGPAIQTLAQDRHLQISYVPEEVGERRTLGAVGQFDAQGALKQLLEGTGLTFEVLDDKTITIVPIMSEVSSSSAEEDEGAEATAATSPPSNTTPGIQPPPGIKAAPLPQITVEAQREVVRKHVTDFVRIVTTQISSQESVPRWGVKVCPSVAGLPTPQNEFILQRVLTIAREAGIGLGAKDCRPNFWVMITADPARLVQEIRAQYRFLDLSGQPATATQIRRFIDDPRPIHAWYSIQLVGAMGNELGTYDELPQQARAPKVNRLPTMSRLRFDDVQAIQSTLVVADRKRIAGLSLGAVADYVSMIGLADINLQGDYSSAETILNLFSAPDAGRPVNHLSAWDAAFLRALYATDQSSRSHVAAIVEGMIHDPETVAVTPSTAHP